MIYQRTIKNTVSCYGIGLHTGRGVTLTLKPAAPNSGILFKRVDLPGQNMIEAKYENLIDTKLATTLGKGEVVVQTVEHLLAALMGLNIDNTIVELDAPEIPIMDGSAAPFIHLIKSAGIRNQDSRRIYLVIKKAIKIKEGDKTVSLLPSRNSKISYTIDFEHPLLKEQSTCYMHSEKEFIHEIATARTFGFKKEVEFLLENGFAKGGSLDNAVIVDDYRVLNKEGLRFEDEFVRHKILDSIGDLSLLGKPIIGHLVAYKSGHSLNAKLVSHILKNKNCWKLVQLTDKTLSQKTVTKKKQQQLDFVTVPNYAV